MKELIDYLKNNDIKFEENISLRKKTWIKTQKATAKTRKQLLQRYETADMDVG